jgi:hypothetical protein
LGRCCAVSLAGGRRDHDVWRRGAPTFFATPEWQLQVSDALVIAKSRKLVMKTAFLTQEFVHIRTETLERTVAREREQSAERIARLQAQMQPSGEEAEAVAIAAATAAAEPQVGSLHRCCY